ncbi:transporter substrate-binding domain-containing protein [Vibrio sp. MA40-2]|uniref:transporter substrate-binding domain-containing protein n=1 Tax=Vibrio sp. MA40-2 TaxID=3391828 RepID=UPI0039A64E8D
MNKFSFIAQLLLRLFVLCFTLTVFANENTIIVGGDHNYPPYEFINDNGQPDGYNTELTYAIAQVMGLDVKIELSSWDVMKNELESGYIDVLQGISYSEERSKRLDFSPPHSLIHQSVFARVGSAPIANLSDLAGKSVIVQSGGIMAERIKSSAVDAQLIYVDTHAAALRMLSSGRYDYAFVANLPGLYLGKELSLSNIEPVGEPVSSQRYGYAVLKGNDELLARFNEGLAILKNTGKQQEIYNKWFGSYTATGVNWQQISRVVVVISVLVILIFSAVIFWNRSLAKQVARRTKELERQQQQLIQADKMTSLGVLVSGVAHEINNPTSLLLLNLPVLEESFDDIADILQQHYQDHGDFEVAGLNYTRMRNEIPLMLSEMLEGSHHIRRIVNDLRDFARKEPHSLVEDVDLNQVVAAAIRLTDRTIKESTQHFSVDYFERLPTIKGNSQRLQQVVINLIVNACQALQNIQQSIVISVQFNPYNRQLMISVKDEGCGIEADNLSRLTDPFFTTKRKQGGTGLGLSISTTIVEEHAGKLTFQSEIGKGTIIELMFPLDKEKQ